LYGNVLAMTVSRFAAGLLYQAPVATDAGRTGLMQQAAD
jgi:hypothetical protein